jgi:hypothetical protein
MTFKEFLASRQRSFSRPVHDFRTYITTDPSVPDFTERAELEAFLANSPSLKVRVHNVIAGQAWNTYRLALKRQQSGQQLDAA